MLGSITLSCGCKFSGGEDFEEVSVMYRDWSCDAITGYSNAVAHASYCRKCADDLKQTPYFIATEEEAEAWMSAGDTDLPDAA